MSIQIVVEVLDHRPPGLSDADTLLLLALAENARDQTRIAMPGHDILAARCRCTQRTVRRRLASLIDAGLLELVSAGHRSHRARYRMVNLPLKADAQVSAYLDAGMPVDNCVMQDAQASAYTDPADDLMADTSTGKAGRLSVRQSNGKADAWVSAEPSENLNPHNAEPSPTKTPAVNSPVENPWLAPGQNLIAANGNGHRMTAIERAALAASNGRHAKDKP